MLAKRKRVKLRGLRFRVRIFLGTFLGMTFKYQLFQKIKKRYNQEGEKAANIHIIKINLLNDSLKI